MFAITPKLKQYLVKHFNLPQDATEKMAQDVAAKAFAKGNLSLDKVRELSDSDYASAKEKVKSIIAEVIAENGGTTMSDEGNKNIGDLINASGTDGANTGDLINVKPASSMYKTTKSVGKHVKTGQPVLDECGRQVETPSEQEIAKAGALFKHFAARQGINVSMSQHDKELVEECYQKDRWCGYIGRDWETNFSGLNAKALLSDSTSGAVEINPIWFDDLIIKFPLLHSELFPFITLREVPRGSRVESASMTNPSVTWGVAEGSSIGLFDTDAMVSAIDTTIHPVATAIEVGRDLMDDAAINVGQEILESLGQRMLEELDNVIVNGTNRPEGIFNASGISVISSDNGNTGPPTIADYEALIFAVGKQYRTAAMRNAFISNDTTYSRARGIAVGGSDQRRVFGMNHQSYQLLEYPYRIQNSIANTKVAFGALAKYRLYRRKGHDMRWIDQDAGLALKNKRMLIVRGRYGGQVMDANAFALMTDAQT